MKKISSKILIISVLAGLTLFPVSCTEDLLEQQPTTEMGASAFWQTEADATTALYGLYSSVRPLFDRDYYFDGQGEYVRTRGNSTTSGNLQKGDAYNGGNYNPSGYGSAFDKYFRYLYGGVNNANYVIENVEKMLPSASATSLSGLETIIGEARLLRGMVYFRLISMWGDVPYIGHVINSNSEVENIERMPVSMIKDSIMADFTYAFEKLPLKASQIGRASKPAALAFRGKLQLYWASWNKFGWTELSTFTPSVTEADAAYKAAAADFKSVIEDYGLNLFRNGDPGSWGTMGNADVLPNYYYMFIPSTGNPNADGEMIMVFTHGGTGTDQGEELMRDVAGRLHEGSQCWVTPRYEIADRYQSTITGDFAAKLIPTNPSTSGARTKLNSAVNPASYANRDYRMKASIMWDYEKCMSMLSLKETGWIPFIYKTWNASVTIDGVKYTSYNTDGCNSGYVFRKFLRNYAGQGRSEGDYNWPVMRLADVFLMYAEATNEAYGPQTDAIALVNRIRHRGNLPPLAASKTADKASFFAAIEQERIVELLAEGHRGFDLRRWRAIDRVWCPPYGAGVWRIDTQGANQTRYFQNASELSYQQCYIFRIPPSERDRNPNLTQNTPWL
ncbi:MAG: starch-binding protein [Bacteroidetes bacterium GWF2_42_66]|nr:MAG: starch-binding protein [Bacteroidetes bacterium GWA2_42_15]OFX96898.1 MAG: starch-binding protein [Bacteroidetes bacterium GWE2_42_39]OFY44655.1 MAG: starch-binding protein [Bacteroidetes bacterium GWF2_42_66]HBL75060.1 RagB/SusD family nutrient uptake outer membrane protein [Prolixibacteraceae bacterium]HCU60267.1 RagB/SusD family nutrient uptake outer membrane protein [Prolixibacteraceae bacterium]